MTDLSRRRLLALVASGATGLAGCGAPADDDAGDGTSGGTTDPGTTVDGGPGDATGTTDATTGGGPTTAAPPTTGDDLPDAVALEPVVTGLDAPVDVAFAPDADRRYVVEQSGVVHVHGPDGLRDRPFLDLSDRIEYGGEKGLLGIALHPNFSTNQFVFVRYSAPPREGTPSGYSHTFVLSQFTATDDGAWASRGSEMPYLEIPQPQANHNAGSLGFGPRGYLHVGVGDGGAGGDQGTGHVEDWYDAVPGGNGQDVTANLLGSILRIDVDQTSRAGPYDVPADNPLVGREGHDEQYAWGFRNPWRFSFDDHRLFVGDVGQNRYEEVDVVEKGANYGWNVREGRHCYGASDCPERTPESVRGGEELRDPIVEYPHRGEPVSGISVIGGVVARDAALPGLEGRYVFGDYAAGGELFVATPSPGGVRPWSTAVLPLTDADADRLQQLRSFGRDAEGRVYVLGTGTDGGGLYRVVPAG